MRKIGEKLQDLRSRKNVTTREVAQAVGIPQSRYSELEQGVRIATEGQVGRLAKYYGVSADELTALLEP